jgi:hypothetical protein
MTPDSNAPLPGSMTVPPLDGWVGLLLLLAAAIIVGLCFLVIGATGRSTTRSSEWEALLDARSRRPELGGDASEPDATGWGDSDDEPVVRAGMPLRG